MYRLRCARVCISRLLIQRTGSQYMIGSLSSNRCCSTSSPAGVEKSQDKLPVRPKLCWRFSDTTGSNYPFVLHWGDKVRKKIVPPVIYLLECLIMCLCQHIVRDLQQLISCFYSKLIRRKFALCFTMWSKSSHRGLSLNSEAYFPSCFVAKKSKQKKFSYHFVKALWQTLNLRLSQTVGSS